MSENSHVNVLSAFGEPQLCNPPGRNLRDDGQVIHYQETVTFFNYTKRDVHVLSRNGIKVTIPKKANQHSDEFVVRFDIYMPRLVEINADRLLNVINEHSTDTLKLLQATMSPQAPSGVRRPNRLGGTLHLEYTISLTEFEHYGSSLYLHDVDKVISTLPYDEVPDHPYSENSLTITIGEKDRELFPVAFSMKIVDNIGDIGDQFLNLDDRVFRVRAQEDPTLMDGVYVFWRDAVDTQHDTLRQEHRRLSLKEAREEFKLFRTFAEAKYANESVALNKREAIADKQLELEQLRADKARELLEQQQRFSEIEARYKSMQAERDEVQAKLDAELKREMHRKEMQKLDRKDTYESRSHERKDTSEQIKFIPALIVGVVAIVVALKALF